MDSKMRTIYAHKWNKEISSKFPEGYTDWQSLDEGSRAQQLKYCHNNKDGINNLHVTNINNCSLNERRGGNRMLLKSWWQEEEVALCCNFFHKKILQAERIMGRKKGYKAWPKIGVGEVFCLFCMRKFVKEEEGNLGEGWERSQKFFFLKQNDVNVYSEKGRQKWY